MTFRLKGFFVVRFKGFFLFKRIFIELHVAAPWPNALSYPRYLGVKETLSVKYNSFATINARAEVFESHSFDFYSQVTALKNMALNPTLLTEGKIYKNTYLFLLTYIDFVFTYAMAKVYNLIASIQINFYLSQWRNIWKQKTICS